MHSSETVPPASGPALLQQLSRLIVRARSVSPRSRTPRDRHHAKGRTHPSTSTQAPAQPITQAPKTPLETQLDTHVQVLWDDHIPVSIEVLLAPDCKECYTNLRRMEQDPSFDKPHSHHQGLLLERWTLQPLVNKSHDAPAFITSQWLLNAVRSQLHFSQLAAWLARLKGGQDDGPQERRRKLSREQCNFKKLESNCDDSDTVDDARKLNIVYSIKIPGESFKAAEFTKKPTDHTFPVTDIGNNIYLKVVLQSLPRLDDIPIVKCTCPKRRASKELPKVNHEELVGKLNDLSLENYSINPNNGTTSRFADFFEEKKDKILDDRMHTTCNENGKHKCNCDEESDNRSFKQETKKLDERRIKEIAKYKRRLRKENKLKKLCDSTSSEGDGLKRETHTSIPILQAARFDRLRAIGCYRNQTYLTLPASRIETKSPFVDSLSIPPTEFKRTVSVSTQTDDLSCQCGVKINMKCESCRLVRSEANYNLCLEKPHEQRKRKDETESLKLKCDNFRSNLKCDNDNLVDVSDSLIKRPKLRRFLPMVGRIERVMTDRKNNDDNVQKMMKDDDLKQLHLKDDDSVFTTSKHETKRQKTFSINDDDYVMFEKCDYGTVDRFDTESPKEDNGFQFPDPKSFNSDYFGRERDSSETNGFTTETNGRERNGTTDTNNHIDDKDKNLETTNHCQDLHCQVAQDKVEDQDEDQKVEVPSPSEMDRFRWRFDSAASMVFHTKTGLPLTSSPAPLRRGNNCFDFDDSINGISGIKSALYQRYESPAPPSPPPRPAPARRLRVGSSTGLLGTFEESALKGRLEPVATVAGFTCELGASGSFCPPHRRLPVTVFFYAPGGTNAPYMGHINLGPTGYRVARSGTIQVSLFNPHGTLVKMFVVLYDLTCMPPLARTFLRQRTLYMPAGAEAPSENLHKWLRYLIHLRFMTSKSGKLYLHTDIRILVSRKADLDTATAHSALFRPISTNHSPPASPPANHSAAANEKKTNESACDSKPTNRTPNRVFGGSTDFDERNMREIGYDNQNGVSYELRSFTYAPENPKYSPR